MNEERVFDALRHACVELAVNCYHLQLLLVRAGKRPVPRRFKWYGPQWVRIGGETWVF
jgi:hypothetical protein